MVEINSIEFDICKNINTHYEPIKNYVVGNNQSRGMSWEWCHNQFIKVKNKENIENEDKDYLALLLFMYLASWGMLRNSKLMDCDYKILIGLVEILLKAEYCCLWDYDPENKELDVKNVGSKFENVYNEIKNYLDIKNISATTTLVSKILLGTYACIPAFDNALNEGIKTYKKKNKEVCKEKYPAFKGYEDKTDITEETLESLAEFYKVNCCEINKSNPIANKSTNFSHADYPPMKLVDMYFNNLGEQYLQLKKEEKK